METEVIVAIVLLLMFIVIFSYVVFSIYDKHSESVISVGSTRGHGMLLIHGCDTAHSEIVESLIVNRAHLGFDESLPILFYLKPPKRYEDTFRPYLKKYYPQVTILDKDPGTDFQHVLHMTRYNGEKYESDPIVPGHIYIMHNYKESTDNENFWYISPFGPKERTLIPDILPFSKKSPSYVDRPPKTNPPTWIVQGRFVQRDWKLINKSVSDDYDIVAIGYGDLPEEASDSIVFKKELDFIQYHKVVAAASGLISGITREFNDYYYTTTLTSTASYARAYDLDVVVDDEFMELYKIFELRQAK